MAFRPGQIDRIDDDDDTDTSRAALTLPEVMPEIDAILPDFNDFDCKVNQSRIDEITLKEDLITDVREPMLDDEFGMDDFGEKEFACFGGDDDDFGEVPRAADGSVSFISHTPFHTMSTDYANGDLLNSRDDDFGGPSALPDDDFGDFGDGGGDPMIDDELFADNDIAKSFVGIEAPGGCEQDDIMGEPADITPAPITPTPSVSTSMISTAPEFTLDPLDTTALQSPEKTVKSKRRRKLLVDEQRNITGDEMKSNMADTSDTLTKLKESGHCDQLMGNPGCSFLYNRLVRTVYHAQLSLGVRDDEEAPQESENGGDFDIRKDLDMVENVDDDFQTMASEPFDDFDVASPSPEFNEPTLDEPAEAETEALAAPEEGSPRAESPLANEKPKRKSKANEKNADEDEEADGEEPGHRWTRRTQNVLKTIATKLRANDEIHFADLLSKGSSAKTAAQKFYAVLELKKAQAIDFAQQAPFAEIRIASGAHMASFIS
uniref:Rad21_Rec8 domain-containing protein n=1 Tax=Steinernema glaseri TaxID=37863 RepID=A0A1I7ZNQ7_9BILA